MREPGPLLAAGRDAEIFEYSPGLVLRRARTGRSLAYEARVMEYARSHGFPVPAVKELSDDGASMVMERVDGTDMVSAAGRGGGLEGRRPPHVGRGAGSYVGLVRREAPGDEPRDLRRHERLNGPAG